MNPPEKPPPPRKPGDRRDQTLLMRYIGTEFAHLKEHAPGIKNRLESIEAGILAIVIDWP